MIWLTLAVAAGALDEIVWLAVYTARLAYRYTRYWLHRFAPVLTDAAVLSARVSMQSRWKRRR